MKDLYLNLKINRFFNIYGKFYSNRSKYLFDYEMKISLLFQFLQFLENDAEPGKITWAWVQFQVLLS